MNCKNAGIKNLRINDLRLTAATRMVASKWGLGVVTSTLGHSDTRITSTRHAHPLPELRKKAIQALANYSDKNVLDIAQ